MDQQGMDNLEEAARRMDVEERAVEAFTAARIHLILGKGITVAAQRTNETPDQYAVRLALAEGACAFFSTLALNMELVPDWYCQPPTAWTDGKKIGFHPDSTLALTGLQRIGRMAHEVGHPMLCHHTRRGYRNKKRWNVSCDLALNWTLRDAGFSLPPTAIFPGEGHFKLDRDGKPLPLGLSAEEYYVLLPEGCGGDESDDGEGDGDGCGGVRDATDDAGNADEAAAAAAERDWKNMVAQAWEVATQRGTLPGGLERLIESVLRPSVPWRNELRDFVRKEARADYSWARANRKHIWRGLYLPTLFSEELGVGVLHVDTSLSTSEAQEQFAAELQGVVEAFPCTLYVVYADTIVQRFDVWRPSDGKLEFNYKGGGGTDHVPVFEWIDEQVRSGEIEEVSFFISLTDMQSNFPKAAPDFPVLWAVIGEGNMELGPAWGRRIHVTV